MIDLVGERPFKADDQYQEYVSARAQRNPETKEEDTAKEVEEETEINDNGSGLTPGLA
jgi:hypothetical protein